jgi:hypothetical protein
VLLAVLLPAHGIDGAALAWLAAQTAALAVAVAGCLAPVLGSHPVEVQAA